MLHCSKVQGVRRPGDKRGWSYTSRHETASAVIVNLLTIHSCACGSASTIPETGGNASIYASFLYDGDIGLRYIHANLFSPRFPQIANSNSISVLHITLCVICVFLHLGQKATMYIRQTDGQSFTLYIVRSCDAHCFTELDNHSSNTLHATLRTSGPTTLPSRPTCR